MLLLVSAYPVAGQHGPTTARPAGSGLYAAIGAHVVPLVTHVSPIRQSSIPQQQGWLVHVVAQSKLREGFE
jgi:hypothetical protein